MLSLLWGFASRPQCLGRDKLVFRPVGVPSVCPEAAGLRIIGGSDPASEAIVHETLAAHATEHRAQSRSAPAWAAERNPRRR
jgi:hypothetical protein